MKLSELNKIIKEAKQANYLIVRKKDLEIMSGFGSEGLALEEFELLEKERFYFFKVN